MDPRNQETTVEIRAGQGIKNKENLNLNKGAERVKITKTNCRKKKLYQVQLKKKFESIYKGCIKKAHQNRQKNPKKTRRKRGTMA
jgi:hypothetical protein